MKKLEDGTRLPTVTEEGIFGFFGDYRFLSNFEECEIYHHGITYTSSEALYMALKTTNRDLRKALSKLPPNKARRFGQQIPLRPNWENIKVAAMYEACFCKFDQNPVLQAKLLETGNLYLEETNDWGDRFWGADDWAGSVRLGENNLGKVLMMIRDELSDRALGWEEDV